MEIGWGTLVGLVKRHTSSVSIDQVVPVIMPDPLPFFPLPQWISNKSIVISFLVTSPGCKLICSSLVCVCVSSIWPRSYAESCTDCVNVHTNTVIEVRWDTTGGRDHITRVGKQYMHFKCYNFLRALISFPITHTIMITETMSARIMLMVVVVTTLSLLLDKTQTH